MKGLISIYLDVFRFVAAMGVFSAHVEQHFSTPGVLPKFAFAHKSVIFFFVISGYVIAASTARPDKSLANYTADRLARLSSVVIPALILTYILDAIGSRVSPEVYSSIDPHHQPIRFLLNFFYVQQIWFLCVNPSSNAPFWSLSYEFWYYAFFAVCIFIASRRARAFLLVAIAIFIGPKILLLLPAWAAGAVAFRLIKDRQISYRNSVLFFVVSGLALAVVLIWQKELGLDNERAGEPPLFYSANFLGDNILAVIVAIHFAACALFSKNLTTNLEPYRGVKLIRWAASHTFSLYVYHMPLLYFVRAMGKYQPNHFVQAAVSVGVVLLIIVGLSKVTEEKYPALRMYLRARLGCSADKWRVTLNKWKLRSCQ